MTRELKLYRLMFVFLLRYLNSPNTTKKKHVDIGLNLENYLRAFYVLTVLIVFQRGYRGMLNIKV